MTRISVSAAVLLIALSACSADKSSDPEVSEVTLAADIANAIHEAPTKTDSILAAHSLTADQLEQMMYRIAADSVNSAVYRALTEH